MSPPALSAADETRLRRIEQLAGDGPSATAVLIDALTEPAWTVRRAVVAALARLGNRAIPALVQTLVSVRGDETRNAAAVDALVLSTGDVEAALFPLGDYPNPAVVYDVVQILGRRRAGPGVPLLTQLTSHADDNVAVAAIEALGQIGGRSAVKALITAAQSGNFFRTFPVIDVLGRSGDPEAVAALLQLLEQPVYAAEVVRALGRTGDERAVRPLVALFSRPGDTLLRSAALALAEIDAFQQVRYGQRHVVAEALRAAALPASLGKRMIAAMRGAAEPEQVALCKVLGWIGGEDAVESLLALLREGPAVAKAAADGLAAIGATADDQLRSALRSGKSEERAVVLPFFRRGRGAFAEVVACLEDPEPAVRTAACEALARIGDTAAVDPLFARLEDPDTRVANAALGAIQALGSPRTEELTLQAVKSADPKVRRAALRIIAYFGYPTGLPALIAAMGDADEKLRDAAIYGLPFVDDPRARETLLAAAVHSSARTRGAAMRALGQGGRGPAVLAALQGGLNDADSWVRYYAVQSLGKLGDASSAAAITALMNDPAGQVRVAVVDALAALGTDAAFLALIEAASSPDGDVERAALLGLGGSRRPEAVSVLRAAAASSVAATRLVALSAVANLRAPESAELLIAALQDPDPSVRNAAFGFLAESRGPGATERLVGLLARAELQPLVLQSLASPVDGRIDGLLHALEGADETFAPLLVGALARMDRPDALGAVYRALDIGSPASRKAAAQLVGTLSTEAAKARLERAAREDPDPEVRRICTLALVP